MCLCIMCIHIYAQKQVSSLQRQHFLDIVAVFHVTQKVYYAALVGMKDFQIQTMLQMC